MPVSHRTEKEIFSEALDIASAEARGAYLQGACGDDHDLRERVESLLKAHGGAGRFLEGEPQNDPGTGNTPLIGSDAYDGPGSIIDRYKLLQKIGEGGFGVVYMAEQREPVKRKVALKIIKLGMDTKQVIGRFEAERQALAMMDHPNIAKVLDGGAAENGRPFFVMELVRGVPLMEFCDEQHLTLPERLDLFIQICGAIQHAHQKGVIHRDIKPSNIMITMHDDRPVPKVIDFGIAKATQQDLTDKTVFTRFQEFLGTPAYMSPEQAQMSGLDIDTRSDIYALGVLLYEMLTGRTPFDTQELVSGGYDEMRRRIREEEPLKPSTRLKTLSREDRTHVAKRRRVEPAQLGTLLKGDLDWVVMKAIEKNRSRRYESAGALAQDVQRFLKQEPVTAAAPTWGYIFGKFAQRHRTILTTAILLALLLVAGVLVSANFAVKAKRAEAVALRQAAIADAVKHFLNEDLFTQADPQVEPDRELRLKTAIDRAARQIGERFRDQPLVEAEIRSTLARAYRNLGENDLAEGNSRRAYELRLRELGELNSATIEALSDVAMVQIAQQKRTEALETGKKVVSLATNNLGRLHPLTLKTMSRLAWICYGNNLNTNAYELAAEVVSLAPQVPNLEPEYHAQSLYVLGRTLGRRQLVKEGEEKLREAQQLLTAAFGPSHPFTLYSKNFLAAYQFDHRLNLQEAESLYQETMEQWRRTYGETHLKPLMVRRNLVYLYEVQKRFLEATHYVLKLLEFFPPDRQEGDLKRLNWLLQRTPPEAIAGAAQLTPENWLGQDSPPGSTWTQPQFLAENWEAQRQVTQPEQWWRQSFELAQTPKEQPVIFIRNSGDFEVFLNGRPARQQPYGKLEKFQVVICDPQVQANLVPGRNVIALHGRNLQPGEQLDVQLCKIPSIASPPPRF